MEISTYHYDNIGILLKVKSKFIKFKIFLIILFCLLLVLSLFLIEIPKKITLNGIVKCNKKDCTFTSIVSSNVDVSVNQEIKLKDVTKILKVSYDEPYLFDNHLVTNLVLTVSNNNLVSNQIMEGTIIVSKDTIFSLFWHSLKGGD